MKIKYLGHSCFYIESEDGVTIITDPYTKVGYELPEGLQADILTLSHAHFDHNYAQAVKAQRIFNMIGEYVYQGIKIRGISSWHDSKQGSLRGDNIIFKFDIDGISVCHFGDLGEGYSETIAKALNESDVWLIPVGGTYTIDGIQAKEYIEKLQPKVVIPMHYLPNDGALDIADARVFLNMMREYPIAHAPNGDIILNKEDLVGEKPKIIYMERIQ